MTFPFCLWSHSIGHCILSHNQLLLSLTFCSWVKLIYFVTELIYCGNSHLSNTKALQQTDNSDSETLDCTRILCWPPTNYYRQYKQHQQCSWWTIFTHMKKWTSKTSFLTIAISFNVKCWIVPFNSKKEKLHRTTFWVVLSISFWITTTLCYK